MRTNDNQMYQLYNKIYEIVEFADYEIDDEDLRVACKYVIRDLELDQRFYHKSSWCVTVILVSHQMLNTVFNPL